MANNKTKDNHMAAPVERHETAAWRNHIVNVKPQSNVGIPSQIDVDNAKEWVDSNEK